MSDPVAAQPLPLSSERRLVGVQFRRAAAMIYDFEAGDLPLAHDTRVVVEGERGEAIGWTVGMPEERDPLVPDAPVRRVLRIANEADRHLEVDHQQREQEALRFCAQRARQLSLPMKLIAVEWSHSGDKAAFYFSSEERVDFRALVRELAQHYRIRVEMRQVGPRDEAKIIGAMGPCGRETCCSSWMRAFTPVSIKMAKDQGLALNPQKVSGVCGRLLCCLAYEQDTYRDLRRKLPRFGKQVMTPRGSGRIVDVLVLRERVRVLLGDNEVIELAANEVRPLGAAPVEEVESETDASDSLADLPAEAPVPAPVPRPAPHRERPPRQERPQSRPPRPPSEARPPSPPRPPSEARRPSSPKLQGKGPPPSKQRHQEMPRPPPPARSEATSPKPKPEPGATPASAHEPGGSDQSRRSRHRRRRRGHGPAQGHENKKDEGSDSN